ncbi:ABC transporter permease [Bacillus mycoides]|uniref:ABC transporter permease n=1 Tax=Bacillus mycoides TaxID=1405 RepID=UPI0011A7CC19|nr:ABC transporter permease [Bacillus mycoides]
MINLIKNELMKIFVKKNVYVFLTVLLTLQVATAFIIKSWLPAAERFSSYVTFTQFNFTIIAMLVTIFSISLMVKSIADEFQQGTIKQLLIRPKTRVAILLSKYFAMLITVVMFIAAALLVSMLVGGIRFGWTADDFTLAILFKIVLYEFVPIFFYITLALMLASIITTTILPVTITLFMFLLQSHIVNIATSMLKKYSDIVVLNHLSLRNLDANPLIGDDMNLLSEHFTLTASFLYVAVHLLVMLVIASVVFKKRDIL